MKAVIQRVLEASVVVDGQLVSAIGPGMVTLLGIVKGDDTAKLEKLIKKICELRIFEDENGKMNRSLFDIQGEHLLISQFTLAADCGAGRRPSFVQAENPEIARTLYDRAIYLSQAVGIRTQGGVFQADMKISLINNGPATFILEI